MIVLTRSFVRKRVISLATTLCVGATSLALAHGPTKARPTHAPVVPLNHVADRSDSSNRARSSSENDAATNRVIADTAVTPTGDVGRDLVAMMVPRHPGTIADPVDSVIVDATGPIAQGHGNSRDSIVQGQLK